MKAKGKRLTAAEHIQISVRIHEAYLALQAVKDAQPTTLARTKWNHVYNAVEQLHKCWCACESVLFRDLSLHEDPRGLAPQVYGGFFEDAPGLVAGPSPDSAGYAEGDYFAGYVEAARVGDSSAPDGAATAHLVEGNPKRACDK